MYLRHLSRDDDKTDRCDPIAHWLRLCIVDIFTILIVAFMIWYIIWGIPLTLRLIKWSKATLAAQRSARSLKKLHLRNNPDGASEKDRYIDPYLSPTRRLRKYLTRSRQPSIPQPIFYRTGSYSSTNKNLDADPFIISASSSSSEDRVFPIPRPLSTLVCSVSELLAAPLSPGASVHFTDGSLYSPDPKSPVLATPPPAYLDFYSHTRDQPTCKPCSW